MPEPRVFKFSLIINGEMKAVQKEQVELAVLRGVSYSALFSSCVKESGVIVEPASELIVPDSNGIFPIGGR